jgi:hypothetical protein
MALRPGIQYSRGVLGTRYARALEYGAEQTQKKRPEGRLRDLDNGRF